MRKRNCPAICVFDDLRGPYSPIEIPLARDSKGTGSVDVAWRRPPSLVVGIGASAGGLAAFKSFFAADTGMAFVLVQHLDPGHKSMLVELLRPHTTMNVVEAEDGPCSKPAVFT
jgi:chemotaxis response regulator CheB